LVGIVKDIGIDRVHLGVGDLLEKPELAESIAQELSISATMIDFPQEDYSTLETIKVTGGVLPDDCWESNLERFAKAAQLTGKLGVDYLTFHAGFIDEFNPAAVEKMVERIQKLADVAAENGVTILLETGQETAEELVGFMYKVNHKSVGVNFDPANMILYNKGNPIDTLGRLAPWIKHVHIKDATKTKTIGEWGAEVPWGDGEVDAKSFLTALDVILYKGSVAIEREAGDNRVGDIKLAASRLTGQDD
jgi:sugar phosphate isomerase/epimerase